MTGLATLFAVWPLVHMALQVRYELSPWKLGGWGMYAEPRFDNVGMEIYGRESSTGDFAQLTSPTPAEHSAGTRFLESHRWLRRLAPQGRLVRAVFDAHPRWTEIDVVVFQPHMDAVTGMIDTGRHSYRHRRDG